MTLAWQPLKWSSICPNGEHIHLASVECASARAPILHTHDFYECFWVEEGCGKHVLDSGEVPLPVNNLYFIRPEHAHGFQRGEGQALRFINVAFPTAIATDALKLYPSLANHWRKSAVPHSVRLSPTQCKQFKDLVEAASAGQRDTLDALCFVLNLARLLRGPTTDLTPPEVPDWLQEALLRAVEPQNLKAGLKRIVQLCSRSPEHVSRTFLKHLDQTPTDWLIEERIRLACRLLETTHRSILDIAFDCGFESPSYFHKCFRQKQGTTPLNYRRRTRRATLIL